MGKVSDQITQFTETYSSIVVGMHKDISQYRKEVQSLTQNSNNKTLEENLYRIYNSAKQLAETNNNISSKIEDKKSEIERFYREIAGSARRIKLISEEVDKANVKIDELSLKVSRSLEDLSRLNTSLVVEKGKNISLRSDITNINLSLAIKTSEIESLNSALENQAKQLYTQKLLLIGGLSLLVFILLLTIIL